MNDSVQLESTATATTEVTDGSATRATLEVPSPYTKLVAGEDTIGGVTVETAKHIRLNAKGDRDESDAIVQATGQLWIQATQNLVGIGKKKVVISSRGNTAIAAKKSITFMAGFAPAKVSSETAPGVLPDGIASYEDSASAAGTAGTMVNAVMIGVTAAVKVAQSAVGNSFGWASTTAAAANVAGSVLNTVLLTAARDADLPGVSFFSQSGTLVGSLFAGINVFGLPGVLIASTFATQLGLAQAKIRGFKRSSMSAVGPIDLSGMLDLTIRARDDTVVASRTGALGLRGLKMWIGTPNRPAAPWSWMPQKPTQTTTLTALSSIGMTAGRKLVFKSVLGSFKSLATKTTALTALQKLTVAQGDGRGGAVWALTVSSTSKLEIGSPAAKMLEITPAGVVTLTSGTTKAQIGQTSAVVVQAGAGKLQVTPAAVAINGVEFKVL